MHDIAISGLNSYPLKSGRRNRLMGSPVSDSGLVLDRRFVLIRDDVAEDGDNFLSQRFPGGEKLVNVRMPDEAQFWLEDIGESVKVPLHTERRQVVRIHGRETSGIDCGDEVARRFSAYLGISVRLVRADEHSLTPVDSEYASTGRVAFGDGYPFLIVNEASLQALNERGNEQISMDRFRGNIVIEGLKPFEEDWIETLEIGGIEFDLVKPCSRCSIPDVDQQFGLGEKGRGFVTERLRQFRKGVDGRGCPATYFGVNAVAKLEGIESPQINVGDQVRIITRKSCPHDFVRGCRLQPSY